MRCVYVLVCVCDTVRQTPEVLILNTVYASALVMLANSLINTYYGPIGSLKWEQNLSTRSASVQRMKDRGKKEEKRCLLLIQKDSLNLPHGIFLFGNPIFPNVNDLDWNTPNEANSFSTPDEEVNVLSLIFQLFTP